MFINKYYIGCVKEWGSSSANIEKQHNGINPIGIDCYNVEFHDSCSDDEQRQNGAFKRVHFRGRKRIGFQHKVFQYIGLLPCGIPVQCSIN